MFSVVEMLACPNRPLTADTGTWSAMSKVALEWRKLWKWAEVRSFAFKNLLNQLVMLWGSNGAPSALVKIRSFLMVLPHISTVRTHADPMRKRCSRCIWRYSRSSSIQLSPTRIIRRERLVLGGVLSAMTAWGRGQAHIPRRAGGERFVMPSFPAGVCLALPIVCAALAGSCVLFMVSLASATKVRQIPQNSI